MIFHRAFTRVLLFIIAASHCLAAESGTRSRRHSSFSTCAPGPWGKITFRPIFLEAPDQVVTQFAMPDARTEWHLPGWSEADARALFARAGFEADLVSTLFDPANHREAAGGHVFCPPVEKLEALTPAQRSVIYAELARYDENPFHKDPIFITTSTVAAWYRGSGMSAASVRLFERMCYKRGETTLFSDLNAFLAHAGTQDEAHHLIKIIMRTRTLAAEVTLSESTDLAEMRRYWSAGGRNNVALPILDSYAEICSESPRFDLMHLLPLQPRKLLQTYPTADFAASGRMPDCHWSSLNFFNTFANPEWLDLQKATAHVLADYERISAPYRLGDILIFLDKNGDAIHSCVHVADQIVYTKNGENKLAPWILSTLGDVKKIYQTGESGTIQGFREKSAK